MNGIKYDYIKMYSVKNQLEEIIDDYVSDLYDKIQEEGGDVRYILDLKMNLTLNKDKFIIKEEKNGKENKRK